MFAAAIIVASTFLEETSDTLGKRGARKRQETVAQMAFLSLFWTVIFLVISTFMGAKFVLREASIPFLALRVVIDITLGYTAALAVVRADRTTVGFMRTLTIPLVLAGDVTLGYRLTGVQIAGVCVLFAGLAAAFYNNTRGRRGSRVAILVAVLSAISAILYKWDITYYNSVAAEQIVVYTCSVAFFYFLASARGASPAKLLFRPITGMQSLADGLGLAIEAFAFSYAPASVVVALKRSMAVIWSIVFGQHYFHEHKVKKKIYAGAILAMGLALLVSPYL
jgi:hypothetical protein